MQRRARRLYHPEGTPGNRLDTEAGFNDGEGKLAGSSKEVQRVQTMRVQAAGGDQQEAGKYRF
jgi:hypothetical protein